MYSLADYGSNSTLLLAILRDVNVPGDIQPVVYGASRRLASSTFGCTTFN